jgi:hypothetical protein
MVIETAIRQNSLSRDELNDLIAIARSRSLPPQNRKLASGGHSAV